MLLRHALTSAGDQTPQRQAVLTRLREIQQRTRLAAEAPPAEPLVREDRDGGS